MTFNQLLELESGTKLSGLVNKKEAQFIKKNSILFQYTTDTETRYFTLDERVWSKNQNCIILTNGTVIEIN